MLDVYTSQEPTSSFEKTDPLQQLELDHQFPHSVLVKKTPKIVYIIHDKYTIPPPSPNPPLHGVTIHHPTSLPYTVSQYIIPPPSPNPPSHRVTIHHPTSLPQPSLTPCHNTSSHLPPPTLPHTVSQYIIPPPSPNPPSHRVTIHHPTSLPHTVSQYIIPPSPNPPSHRVTIHHPTSLPQPSLTPCHKIHHPTSLPQPSLTWCHNTSSHLPPPTLPYTVSMSLSMCLKRTSSSHNLFNSSLLHFSRVLLDCMFFFSAWIFSWESVRSTHDSHVHVHY